jgi:hypothetical protein
MAERNKEGLDVEPSVQGKVVNKHLVSKNSRASENWLRVQNALDREKKVGVSN